MSSIYDHVPNRRAIIDRRHAITRIEAALAAAPGESRRLAVALELKALLEAGRAEIARRIRDTPQRGTELAAAGSFLVDQLVRLAYDVTTQTLYRQENPSTAEHLCLVAVGGYGRAELAPYSDVDIMFLSPRRSTAWVEQVVEAILYTLWDMGLKVGHSVRTVADMVRIANADLSVKTALLEARFLWGDAALYDEAQRQFQNEVVTGQERAFLTDKLAERQARHQRLGDSRYLVEPNVKDGKGGLRDLQTLFWIGKFTMHAGTAAELVDKGLFTSREYRQFQRAQNHLWAVRICLHDLSGRAEERLTFDVQRELAERMGYGSRPGIPAVERFMRHNFLTARSVGTLTALFLSHLEDRFRQKRWLPQLLRRSYRIRGTNGFKVIDGQLRVPDDAFFRADPRRLISLFATAASLQLDIHPQTLLLATRDSGLISSAIRRDADTNRLFLELLTGHDPETHLRRMNEAGVLGRFLPDFGRVVARMQYDMYHHYTVDEHSIRAIGLLWRIDQGELKADHPLSTAIMKQMASRRVLFVAVLLHDIAKGRGGDHSVVGAEVARRLGPRLGLSEGETDMVAWLVRHHLLMANTAFKRDLADPKTISDFVELVASPERLRLLLVLTVVDIRAVGPGVWNNWKATLLSTLFESAEEVLRLGHKQTGRHQRIADRQERLRQLTQADADVFERHCRRFADSYWLAEPEDVLVANYRRMMAADAGSRTPDISCRVDSREGTTLVSVYAPDAPGLFYRIAGGIALAGASIVDARIHTTRDGMALDNFVVQDPLGGPFDDSSRLQRMEQLIADALSAHVDLSTRLTARPLPRHRQEVFKVVPQVFIDNHASSHFTVIEVNALDRPGLLYALTLALHEEEVVIRSAHVATYGERAVDTFYVTGLEGGKIESEARLATLEQRIQEVAAVTANRNRVARAAG